jgi:hypothetical protein
MPKIKDYSKVATNYKRYVLYAYAIGLITGDNKGYFNPKSNLSRAEAATIIMRLLDKSIRKPILTNDEITVELSELLKTDEQVWGREDIFNLTLAGAYTVKDGSISFSEEDRYTDYILDDKLNPDISKQIYQATKVLIDDDHYVLTTYSPDKPTRVHVALAKASQYAFNSSFFFHYIFYEKEPYNAKVDSKEPKFSDNVYITLSLNDLWWDFDTNTWSTPFYETKLNHSLIAIFGDTEGEEIYNYIYGAYLDKRNNPNKYINKNFTKKFSTVKIDFANDDGTTLNFYFSKVGD